MRYERDGVWKFLEPYITLDMRLVAAQNRIVPPEEPTPGYQVMDLGIGWKPSIGKQEVSIRFQVQNLLNRNYLDHTSYYRLINVPEPGRNLILNLSVPFSGRTRSQTSMNL